MKSLPLERRNGAGTLAAVFGMTLVVALVAAVVAGCSRPTVGPFLPAHPQACRADPDCPDHSACRYPAASSPGPVCMTGRESDVYGWSPSGE
jgi:hypothetical protein